MRFAKSVLRRLASRSACLALAACLGAPVASGQPVRVVDLAALPGAGDDLFRARGSEGMGNFGVPVAGPIDCDGDGHADLAFSAMVASPEDPTTQVARVEAGVVYWIFGNGSLAGEVDTAVVQPSVVRIIGAQEREHAGSEIWLDDVTGDGLGDLLIARQDHSPAAGREGAGALTIIAGHATALSSFAALQQPLDLAAPPAALSVTTIVGIDAVARFGIWMRTGDATGDGIRDVLIGSDQASAGGETHRGEAWLLRGGPHLDASQTVDLADFATTGTAFAGDLLRLTPPAGSAEDHFGGTVAMADLDGNARTELLIAAALSRAGATLQALGAPMPSHGNGGTPDGTVYIVWDDAVPAGTWASGLVLDLDALPGTLTTIDGGARNRKFGEEMLGGLDYDGDGFADLFIGDITGDGTVAQTRFNSGMGHVFFDAAQLAGLSFNLDAPPAGVSFTTILGAESNDIAGDTAAHGDFDGDGVTDLAFTAPHATPPVAPARLDAGMVYVIHGRSQPWPLEVDLLPANFPSPQVLRITRIDGAQGQDGADSGDVLGYSASAGDADADGRVDLVINEMLGNGQAPGTVDVGNLLVVSGNAIAVPGVPVAMAAPVVGATLVLLMGRLALRRRRPKEDRRR